MRKRETHVQKMRIFAHFCLCADAENAIFELPKYAQRNPWSIRIFAKYHMLRTHNRHKTVSHSLEQSSLSCCHPHFPDPPPPLSPLLQMSLRLFSQSPISLSIILHSFFKLKSYICFTKSFYRRLIWYPPTDFTDSVYFILFLLT